MEFDERVRNKNICEKERNSGFKKIMQDYVIEIVILSKACFDLFLNLDFSLKLILHSIFSNAFFVKKFKFLGPKII